jgi:hypothetical protein
MFTVYYVAPFLDERSAVYGVLGYASMALLVFYAFGELVVLSALLNAAVRGPPAPVAIRRHQRRGTLTTSPSRTCWAARG